MLQYEANKAVGLRGRVVFGGTLLYEVDAKGTPAENGYSEVGKRSPYLSQFIKEHCFLPDRSSTPHLMLGIERPRFLQRHPLK